MSEQTQCIRIPLRPEAAEEFIAFVEEIAGRRDELLEVLREEGMLAEAVFLERGPAGVSLILFTKARDLQQANAAFLASAHPIQQRMRELSARAFDLEGARLLDVLLDLTGPVG